MYDSQLYDRIMIINAECQFEELERFNININERDFDLDNPFEKYYDYEKITAAIEKYQNEEIDAKYLAYWANAYNWIINGGFKSTDKKDKDSFKAFIIAKITHWLDGLSFFDGSLEIFNLDIRNLDIVYRNIDDCKAMYAAYRAYEDEGYEDIVVLVSNDKAKYFVKMYCDYDFDTHFRVDLDCLKKYEKQLEEDGYAKLNSYRWEDED